MKPHWGTGRRYRKESSTVCVWDSNKSSVGFKKILLDIWVGGMLGTKTLMRGKGVVLGTHKVPQILPQKVAQQIWWLKTK